MDQPTGVADKQLQQPTQVWCYASNVSDYPSGARAGYSLANSVVPGAWQDSGVVKDQYGYDANGNVARIADQQLGLSGRVRADHGHELVLQAG